MNRRRAALIAVFLLGVFIAAIALMVQVIPRPRGSTDYLVIGGIATVLCMALLFFCLIATSFRTAQIFFRRRPAASDPRP